MEVAFPWPCRVRSCVPDLAGRRQEPFINVDGEPFARPTLGGFWRVEMEIVARGIAAQMALSSFRTAMDDGVTTCLLPISTQWRPLNAAGRPIVGARPAPEFSRDHGGYASEPFDGYRLLAPAQAGDTQIDVFTPGLARILPGQFITLGGSLHQVLNVNSINELPRRMRLSVQPRLRAPRANNSVVIVDQLSLRARMEKGDAVDPGRGLFKSARFTFVEAF